MKETKFRAWHKNLHKWYDVRSIDFESRWIVSTTGINMYFEQVDIVQYTGLKDKNGVEIYEGDIVRRYGGGLLGNPTSALFTGEVVFTKNGYKAKYTQSEPGTAGHITEEAYGNLFNESELEVIGNIYENPELLEKAA